MYYIYTPRQKNQKKYYKQLKKVTLVNGKKTSGNTLQDTGFNYIWMKLIASPLVQNRL